MRELFAIYQRELRAYFASPIAYVVIALFLLVSGIFFYLILSNFVELSFRANMQAQYMRQMPPKFNVNMMAIRPLFHNISLFALMFLPLVTMRLFAEEKRTGTIELLFTSPITNAQIVIGKFLAGVTLFAVMIAFTFIYHIFLFTWGNPEFGPIASGYLGLFLIGTSYVAIGALFSSFTENQIVAAVSAMAGILFFWAIGWLTNFVSPGVGEALAHFSLIEHFEDFAKGVIDTKHIVYYLSFISMAVLLTYLSMESTRWRGSR